MQTLRTHRAKESSAFSLVWQGLIDMQQQDNNPHSVNAQIAPKGEGHAEQSRACRLYPVVVQQG